MARVLASFFLSLALVACSDGGGGSPPTPPVPPTPTAPTVTTNPTSVSVPLAGSTSLSATATGTTPITYQWTRDDVPLYGATNPTLTLSSVNVSDGGVYKLVATNAYGTTASTGATVTVAGTPDASDLNARAPRIILVPKSSGGYVPFPNADQSWTATYSFTVPPLPTPFNEFTDSFYIWGDIEFEMYGSEGTQRIHDYKHNQLVPQLMIGNVVGGHHPTNYTIVGKQFKTWVIQAQYFWQKGDVPYAYTGAAVPVNPGETINEVISYDAATKKITLTISGPAGASTVTVDRPFLNEPALYTDWRDFFTKAQAKSGTLWAQPVLSVEPNTTKQQLCGIVPFTVGAASVPTVGGRDGYAVRPLSLPCLNTVKF